jgi:transcriptional antiterminator
MDIDSKTTEIKTLLEQYTFLTVKNMAKRLNLTKRQVGYLLYNNEQFKHIKRAPLSKNKKIIWTLV